MDNKIPFVFTIFGGTGNLTYIKLMPALFTLYSEGHISDQFKIMAIGRRDKTQSQYHDEVLTVIKKKHPKFNEDKWNTFKEKIVYYQMDFSDFSVYGHFKNTLFNLLNSLDTRNIIYYLATAPNFFSVISKYLAKTEIANLDHGFQRVVIEKPFGYDIETATDYNQKISEAFGEDNIYRIDHYLGKEMIQNILVIRFTNKIFESVWNRESIDNIQIVVSESIGIESRGGYYEKSGALKDMVQNHLLQMMALIAMEPPKKFTNEHIRNRKVDVLRNVSLYDEDFPLSNVVFGQYGGYREEERVNPESDTETFVAMRLAVDNVRWRGVPFFLKTGKMLDKKVAQIIVEFKKNEFQMFPEKNDIMPNLLIIKIQPDEGIYFRFNSKEPGVDGTVFPTQMDYCQSCDINYKSTEAYEKLISDCIRGDNTLFTRWDELAAAWAIIDEISKLKRDVSLEEYDGHSQGPHGCRRLTNDINRTWWRNF